MDEELLRSWLGLPPGPWPPNHYTILGLETGHCDPAEVETLVLAQMDRLRMHQLQHPELVTEGMNRLAQALICLTDPVARAAHDTELQAEEPLPDTYGLLPAAKSQVALPPAEPVEEPRPLPPAVWEPKTKRERFARLVALRRLLAAWHRLKPALDDPEEPLDRPATVLALLEAGADLQPLVAQLESLSTHIGSAGTVVLEMLRQQRMLPTFRTLRPEQREALSRDWRRTEQAFTNEQARFRDLVLNERRQRRDSGRAWKLIRCVVGTPEVLLVAVTLATVFVVILRARHVS